MATVLGSVFQRADWLAGLLAVFALPFGSSAQYSVGDWPIGWTDEGLLFFRGHVWVWDTSTSNPEAFTVSCPQSGFYLLGADGSVADVWTGTSVCPFMFYPGQWDLDPDGRSVLVRHQLDEDDIWGAISRVDLQDHGVQTFALDPETSYENPFWIGPDRWAFLDVKGANGPTIRITDSDPESGELLASGPVVGGRAIESYDHERGQFRLRRNSYPMYRSVHAHNARSLVTVVDTLGQVVEPERDVSPRWWGWERRGDWVAYVEDLREPEGHRERSRLPEDWGVAIRNLRTGEERLLFRTEGEDAHNMGHSPVHTFGSFKEGTPHRPILWSPDGGHVVFPRSFEDGMTLWSIPVAGGEAVQLTFRDETQAPPQPGPRPLPPAPRPVPAPDAPYDLTASNIDIMTEIIGHFSARALEGQMVCLTLLRDRWTTRPPPSELVRAAEARWANVTGDECPPTYGVFVSGDPDAPPLNNLDPQHLSVGRPLPAEDGGTLRVAAQVRRVGGGTEYQCSIAAEGAPETIRCRVVSMWMS
ncbi:MAG: hypothetical protein WD120_03540 [Gemmatimonadota bacterium]